MINSNLPPGVTDRMIEEQANGPHEERLPFSPFPWVNPGMEYPYPYYVRSAENGGMNPYIAQVNCGRDEAAANARLICAAPAFFMACHGSGEPGLDNLSWTRSILRIAMVQGWEKLVEYAKEDPDAMMEALQHASNMCAMLDSAMRSAKGK